MKSPAYAFCFGKPGEMIRAIAEDALTPVAAASDVIERTGEFESERPGHLGNVAACNQVVLIWRMAAMQACARKLRTVIAGIVSECQT